MVKIKDEQHFLADGSIDLERWLQHLNDIHHYEDTSLIKNACLLSQVAGMDRATEGGDSCLQQGLEIAEILVDLQMDQTCIAAGIVFESAHYSDLNIDDVTEQLGPDVAKLVKGVERMNAIDSMRSLSSSAFSHRQLDNVRKMLLAMVDDVRVVLIKLAERLSVLRSVAKLHDKLKIDLAHEAMDIYAPLANRLGVGQIKWEMEDLSFRYLQPEKYKEIAKGLNTKRLDRDRYVKIIVETLQQALQEAHIEQAHIYGRSKHIHSIYKKMQRKNIPLSEIYDATAVRVLVDNSEQCYQVLSITHDLWQQITEEFDDYIINPKANGYQSLHTAVIGPEQKVFEVQIRTKTMHEQAEKGIAAHWKYKEGGKGVDSHERKIEWLREVLAWQKDVAEQEGVSQDIEQDYFEDRIYVFSPLGEVFELPKGATAIDFAYHIHTDVGHRCRGAKIEGKIVPLTHQLKTGDQVEILTTNQAKPSRDWLNPHLGFVNTSRAKAKIHHWFKLQDYDSNRDQGQDLLQKEFEKMKLEKIDIEQLAKQYNYKKSDDLYAALGCGDIRIGTIIHYLQPKKADDEITDFSKPEKAKDTTASDVRIEGVGQLLTHYARCCQPLPGDAIIGYITLGKGISVHRQDCSNILHLNESHRERLIDIEWGEHASQQYPVDIAIEAFDRYGLLKDITGLLSSEKAYVRSLNTQVDPDTNTAFIKLNVEVKSIKNLSKLLDKLKAIQNVTQAKRV